MTEPGSTISDIINEIKTTNWRLFNGPQFYQANKVEPNLLQLINLTNESDKGKVYNDVLFALGNNHGGTFYPAVLKALPIIIRLIKATKSELVQNCALEIITEWCCSFDPEMGTYNLMNSDQLKDFVSITVRDLLSNTRFDNSSRNRQLAEELLAYLDEKIGE
ncbi:hypothetical protein [Ferruginibacter sp.]